MSYRLITKATMTIVPLSGDPIVSVVEIRAYQAPKGPAKGQINVDGASTDYKRTSGRGRGLVNRIYLYIPFGKESAYFEITEAQDKAIAAGGTATLEVITTTATEPVAETPVAEEPKATEPVAETPKKAARRAPKPVAA